jgi:hypothetical protein
MRLQDAELRALKGKAAVQAGPGSWPADLVRPAEGAPAPGAARELEPSLGRTPAGNFDRGSGPDLKGPGPVIRGNRAPDKSEGPDDPLAEAEAALQKLRVNPADQQAADLVLAQHPRRDRDAPFPAVCRPSGFP